MRSGETQILQDAIQKAESDLIIFFVVLAVVLVVFIIPLYAMIMKDRKERRMTEDSRIKTQAEADNTRQDKYLERERVIIQVVKENSDVIASLKATLDRDGKTTTASLERIHTRIDKLGDTLVEQSGTISKMQTTLDEVVRKQHVTSEDLKRGFSEVRQNKERSETE